MYIYNAAPLLALPRSFSVTTAITTGAAAYTSAYDVRTVLDPVVDVLELLLVRRAVAARLAPRLAPRQPVLSEPPSRHLAVMAGFGQPWLAWPALAVPDWPRRLSKSRRHLAHHGSACRPRQSYMS